MFSIRSLAFSSSLLMAVLVQAAAATTYMVDATGGSGSQFTDIQAAVSIAAPGDTILVRPGTYASFTVARGVTIRGTGPARLEGAEFAIVNGLIVVAGIPAGERVVMAQIYPLEVTLDACTGPICIENGFVRRFGISNCFDVRLRGVYMGAPQGSAACGLDVLNSRVELVGCSISGSSSPSFPAAFQNGGDGLHARGQSRIHSVFSTFRGGHSAINFTAALISGNGGSGVILDEGSRLRMHAGAVRVGARGNCIAPQCIDCSFDGATGSCIVLLQGSTVQYSSLTQFDSYLYPSPPTCNPVPIAPFTGAGGSQFAPDDPTLGRQAPVPTSAGYRVKYSVVASPGSTVTLWLGRALVVHPTPPTDVEQLVSHDRGFALGVIPPTQAVFFELTIPYGLPPDFLFGAQADVQLPTGELRRTSSLLTTGAGL